MKQLTKNESPKYTSTSCGSIPEKRTTPKKVGKRSKQTCFQRHTDGYQTHEEILNVTHYQETANQNHSEVPFHANQNGCDPKVYKQ